MTVQNDSNVKTYTGNGVTTVFPYDFFIPGDSATDQQNVEVTLLEIATGIEGDPLAEILWSITGVNTDAYGNVTYTGGGTPLPATHKINIRRVLPYEQNLDLTTQSAYFPQLLEEQLDLIVYQVQQLAEEAGRSVKVAVGSAQTPDELIDALVEAAADAEAAATQAQAAETAAEAAQTAAEAAQAAAEAAAAQAGTGSVTYYKWTATAGQTSFTGATATPVLATNPAGKSACVVNVNGRQLLQEEFGLSGVNFTLTFNDIEAGEIVEVGVFTSDIVGTVSNGAITLPKLDSGTLPTLISLEGLALAQGDLLYATAADTLARLAKGTAAQILRMNAGATAPEWATNIVVTPWVPYTPTLTGFGTPSAVQFKSRRVGDSLEIHGKFTSGTSTAVEARFSLGFNGVDGGLIVDVTKQPTITVVGDGTFSVAGAAFIYMLSEPSVGYLTAGVQSSGTAGLTKINATGIIGAGQAMSFFATVPITGWS